MTYEITWDDEYVKVVHMCGYVYVIYLPHTPLEFHLFEPVLMEEGLHVNNDSCAVLRQASRTDH